MNIGSRARRVARRARATLLGVTKPVSPWRQLWHEGIHVSLLIVDGPIGDAGADADGEKLDPRDTAASAVAITRQPASAWSFDVDLRPCREPW